MWVGWWWPEVIPAQGSGFRPHHATNAHHHWAFTTIEAPPTRTGDIRLPGSMRIEIQSAGCYPSTPALQWWSWAFHPGGCRSFHPHQPRWRSLWSWLGCSFCECRTFLSIWPAPSKTAACFAAFQEWQVIRTELVSDLAIARDAPRSAAVRAFMRVVLAPFKGLSLSASVALNAVRHEQCEIYRSAIACVCLVIGHAVHLSGHLSLLFVDW